MASDFHFLLLGDHKVGKKSLLRRLLGKPDLSLRLIRSNTFLRQLSFRRKSRDLTISVQFCLPSFLSDTIPTLPQLQNFSGYLLCYDLTSNDTFSTLPDRIHSIQLSSVSTPPLIIVVGLKSDLTTQISLSQSELNQFSQHFPHVLHIASSNRDQSDELLTVIISKLSTHFPARMDHLAREQICIPQSRFSLLKNSKRKKLSSKSFTAILFPATSSASAPLLSPQSLDFHTSRSFAMRELDVLNNPSPWHPHSESLQPLDESPLSIKPPTTFTSVHSLHLPATKSAELHPPLHLSQGDLDEWEIHQFIFSSGSLPNLDVGYSQIADDTSIISSEFSARSAASQLSSEHKLNHFNLRYQTLVMERNRQEKLLNLLDEAIPIDLVEHHSELGKLREDFGHIATTYGKIIILERYLSSQKKTVVPQTGLGGLAGGEKYIVHDILFKFAVDTGMYGSEYAAAKVAGHEISGLAAYAQALQHRICFPMMCIVDYLGFRLVAMSLLPINSKTLCYGSSDGGQTVRADPQFGNLMLQASKDLNLASHRFHGHTLFAACDLEGHRGLDGHYYLIDFSRAMPPVTPDPDLHPQGHLYRMFRPEAVLMYPEPLCPDGFSRFIAEDPDAPLHNQRIRDATKWLLEQHIPAVSSAIITGIESHFRRGLIEELPDLLKAKLHRAGINLRYLGVVFHHVVSASQVTAFYILSEIFARTAKNSLYRRWRRALQREQRNSSILLECADITAGYLNDLLRINPLLSKDSFRASKKVWLGLFRWMHRSYHLNLEDLGPLFPLLETSVFSSSTELSCHFSSLLSTMVSPHRNVRQLLFLRLQELASLQINETVVENLLKSPQSLRDTAFQTLDIVNFHARLRFAEPLATAHIRNCLTQRRIGRLETPPDLRALQFHETALILSRAPLDPSVIRLFVQVLLFELYLTLKKPFRHDHPRVQHVAHHLQTIVSTLLPDFSPIWQAYFYAEFAVFFFHLGEVRKTQDFLLSSLELNPMPHTLETYTRWFLPANAPLRPRFLALIRESQDHILELFLRSSLALSADTLDENKDLLDWTNDEVVVWLAAHGFAQFQLMFKLAGISGFELSRITAEQLLKLGMECQDSRRLLMKAVHQLSRQSDSLPSSSTEPPPKGVQISFFFEGENYEFFVSHRISFHRLYRKLKHRSKFSKKRTVALFYIDEDGDRISLKNDHDLGLALSRRPLRLQVTGHSSRRDAAIDGELEALSIVSHPVIMITTKGVITFFNPAAEEWFGYDKAAVVGSSVNLLMPPEYAAAHDQHLRNFLKQTKRHLLKRGRRVQALKRDGTVVDVFLTISESKTRSGRHFVGTLQEISPQYEPYTADQSFHVTILHSLIDAAFVINQLGIIQYVNPAACSLFGYKASKLINQNVALITDGISPAAHDAFIKRYLATGQATVLGRGRDVTGLDSLGNKLRLHLSVSEQKFGSVSLFTGICVPNSDPQQLQLVKIFDILDELLVASIVIDDHGSILHMNPISQEFLGYQLADVKLKNVSLLMPPSVAELHDGFLQAWRNGGEERVFGVGRQLHAKHGLSGRLIPIQLSVTKRLITPQRYICIGTVVPI